MHDSKMRVISPSTIMGRLATSMIVSDSFSCHQLSSTIDHHLAGAYDLKSRCENSGGKACGHDMDVRHSF